MTMMIDNEFRLIVLMDDCCHNVGFHNDVYQTTDLLIITNTFDTNYELKNLNHIKILSPNYGGGKILGKMIWEGMCKLVGLI
jgi:hypothetical protein